MKEVKVCANLPYYITSPVIMLLLESRLPVSEIVVMVQKEAGERLCAKAGSREAGAVSIATQYFGEAEVLFGVGRESFMPSPKVDSSVIRIKLHGTPEYSLEEEKLFFRLVKGAFSQRRKTLVNSLSSTLSVSKDTLLSALSSLGLSPTCRAENLTMEDFKGLYSALNQ
jgi:16S rRNA (adenine1518-N6/adenine1519-N6)-dimethyltransferase